jgi:hypothetical protein
MMKVKQYFDIPESLRSFNILLRNYVFLPSAIKDRHPATFYAKSLLTLGRKVVFEKDMERDV